MNYPNDYTGYSNDVLYRMCEEKPRHVDPDIVKSKIIIIGRTYSASIQRKAKKGFKIEYAVQKLIHSKIDAWIDRLNEIDIPNEANISEILQAHKYLVDKLAEATGQQNRSFASKYLHFHARKAIFIYDTKAVNKLQKKLKLHKVLIPSPNYKVDARYTAFVFRCLYYRDKILKEEFGELVSPRKLDNKLLGYWNLK